MKKTLLAFLLTLMLILPLPVSASSFGVSPGNVEIEVPKDGTATQDFTLIGEGTVQIYLVDVPLTITPAEIDISGTEVVTVTFEGDGTNNTYEGEIRFLNMQGENVGAGIIVNLTVHVNCTAEIVAPTPPATGGGGGDGNGGGPSESDHTFSSQDDQASVTVAAGTIIRNSAGNIIPAYSLYSTSYTGTSTPPSGYNIIGTIYQYGPPGVTFNPPISLTLKIPEGTNTEGLKVAFYDETVGKWVLLDGAINHEDNTITAQIAHFTLFTILSEIPTETPLVIVPTPTPTPTPEIVKPITPEPEIIEPVIPGPVVTPPIEPLLVEKNNIGLVLGITVLVGVPLVIVTILVLRKRRRQKEEVQEN